MSEQTVEKPEVLDPIKQVEIEAAEYTARIVHLINQRDQAQAEINAIVPKRRSKIETLLAHKPGFVDPDVKQE